MAGQRSAQDAIPAKISDAIAALYLETFGKGPLHAETYVNGDLVTTFLRDVFTPAEQALIDHGKIDSVLSTRMHWQQVTEGKFLTAVADATGRKVLAAVSGFDPANDLASEVFVLAPE